MLGLSLPVVVVVALALVATAAAVTGLMSRRKRGGGRSRSLSGLRVALAVTALVLPGIALAAASPQATAAQQEHPAAHDPAGAHEHPAPQDPAGAQEQTAPQGQAGPQVHTTTVRYGPLLLPPYLGHDEGHGGHAGQMMTYAAPTYEMPCRNCYITGLQPDLVYADGSKADHDTGAMLHHAVVFDPTKPDSTCGRRGVGLVTGQRVFASGNERTGANLPPGYGYHLGATPLGAMAELMNMSAQPQQVFVTMRVNWVDARDAQLKDVTPVWLDIDNCGDSQYSVPAGPSHTTSSWKSTLTGDIVAAGGHVHDQGVSVTLTNATRNETICRSVADYPSGSHHEGHVESMSTCVGDPVATVHKGDDLVLDSYYHTSMADDTVMGIMIAYLHES